MSDRKYRQRGYQDDDRERRPPRQEDGGAPRGPRPDRPPGAPAGARRISSEGARNPRMPGYREVARCARCGTLVDAEIFSRSACPKCGQALRSCVQCVNFDPGARFECAQPIPARISPKDAANDCPFFAPRTTWERETSSAQKSNEPSGAKKAFDDLFNL
jgi:predicted RNA-binding Zn-ribbon protein involved in translation (DUF1610 family)